MSDSDTSSNPEAPSNWDERVARWLEFIGDPAPAEAAAGRAVSEALRTAWAGQRANLPAAKAAVLREYAALDELRVRLLRMSERIEREWQLALRRRRFDAHWREERGAALRAAFAADPDAALGAWQSDFAAALAAWELDACDWLISLPLPGLDAAVRDGHARALYALRTRPDAGVVACLDRQTARDGPLRETAPGTRRDLLVLKARVQMQALADHEAAAATLELADGLAPAGAGGLVDAAWGELFRLTGRPSEAQAACEKAIVGTPDLPDPYVGCALIAGDAGLWEDADRWLDQAIALALDEAQPLMALQRLRAPCPARLLLRFAAAIGTRDADAARATDLGIAAGTDGVVSPDVAGAPLARAFETRAARRLAAGDAAGAAADLAKAAAEKGAEPAAAALLYQRAVELVPGDAAGYWPAADALFLASYLAEPPYVKPDVLDQALAMWNRGAALGLPEGNDGWAYLTRAVIAERAALLDAERRQSLLWQAVQYTECALLFVPYHGYAWSTLSRLHRALGNEQCALEAGEVGVRKNRDDLVTLEERMIGLVNQFHYAEARALIPAWRKLGGQRAWIDAIEAHLILHTDGGASTQALRQALALSASSLDQPWPWAMHDRATLHLRLGETEAALREWDRLLESSPSAPGDNREVIGFASLLRGRHAAVLEIAQALRRELAWRGPAEMLAGLAYLKRGADGDLEAARTHVLEGLRVATRGALNTWLHEFVPTLRAVLVLDAAAPAQLELLDQLLREAQGAFAARPAYDTPLAEMRHRLADDPDLALPGSDARRGALATFGRLLRAARCFGEALVCYRELDPASATQPWQQGVDLTIEEWIDPAQMRADRGAGARTARQILRELDETGLGSSRFAPLLHLRIAAGPEAPDRFEHLAGAADLAVAGKDAARAGDELVNGIADQLTTAPEIWDLDSSLARLEADATADRRAFARGARSRLIELLGARLTPAGSGAPEYSVAPLRLHVGRGFEPAAAGGTAGTAWKAVWGKIQETILAERGVQLPDIELFDASGVANLDNACVLEVNEVPLWLGNVQQGGMQPLIALVEGVVRSRLDELFHMQDALRWLRHEDSPATQGFAGRKLNAEPADLARLTQMLRALIVEGVTIVNRAAIVDAVMPSRDNGLDAMLQQTRLALREVLPGNSAATAKIMLPAAAESDLLAWKLSERGRAFLAMPADEAQDLLREVRSLLQDLGPDRALVVARGDLRAPLRRVTALENPLLAVLSAEEIAHAVTGAATPG